MAAPTFRAAGLGGTTTTTATTIAKPTGTASGDLLLALVVNGGAATAPGTVPSGWALVASNTISTTLWAGVYSLIAGGAEPANYTWSGFTDSCAGSMIAIIGADTTTPVAASRAQANVNSNIACASITAPVADCLIVGGAGIDDNQLTTDISWACATNPTALTERADLMSSGGLDTGSALATAPQTVQGATGNLTATLAGTRDNVSFLLAIQPPASGVSRTAADTLVLADAAAANLVAARSASDAVTLTDVGTRAVAVARAAADGLGLVDAATAAPSSSRTAADALGLTDSAAASVTLARTAADALSLAETAARSLAQARTGADGLNLADVAVGTAGQNANAADTLTLTDGAARSVATTRAATDALGLADVATRTVALARSAADGLSLADAATTDQEPELDTGPASLASDIAAATAYSSGTAANATYSSGSTPQALVRSST